MAFKTIGDVCKRALELGQLDEVSFLPTARQYYNLVLDDASRVYDWPYFRKVWADQALIPGQRTYDVPDDYKRSDTIYFKDQNGNRKEVFVMAKYRFDSLQKRSDVQGIPQAAYVDLGSRQIVFDQVPSDGGKFFQLTYFRDPVEADDQGGNDSDPIDFESPLYLIQEMTAMMWDFQDDDRADRYRALAMKTLAGLKMNSYDEDADSVLELSHTCFRPGRRGNSNGGFGNGFFGG